MKFIKKYESFGLVNEESQFPNGIYLQPIDNKIKSILEFEGTTLKEITILRNLRNVKIGDRALDDLIHLIISMCIDPTCVNEIFLARDVKSVPKEITKRVTEISFPVNKNEDKDVIKLLSFLGDIVKTKSPHGTKYLTLILKKPIELVLDVNPNESNWDVRG